MVADPEELGVGRGRVEGGERKASAPERGLGRRKELETWHSVVSAALWPLHDVGLWP